MFDLEKHLEEHAHFFQKYADITKEDLHFNFSFLDLQFLKKDMNQILDDFMKALYIPAEYSVKNGIRKNKKGFKQKYTTREIDLSKDIKIEAIHVKGPHGEDTMPHVHLLGNKKARWGKNYSLLKKHISEISKQFGLVANFDTPVEYNPKAIKQLSKAVNKATWRWKQCNQIQLKKSIESNSLEKELDLLQAYTLTTHNLSYYIKSMNQIQSRLNRSKSNFKWNGHNLEDTYPIPLTKEDFIVIDLISNKKFQKKDIEPYINNPILRDYIRYCEKLTEPFILNAIKKQTDCLKGMRRNSSASKSYIALMESTTILRVSDLEAKANGTEIIRKDIFQSLQLALTSATNTNSLISLMQNAGYSNFQFIKSKQKVTACLYTEAEKKYTIKLNDIGLSWKKIQNSIKHNLFKLDMGEDLSTQSIKKQISLSDYIQEIKPNTISAIEPIQYKIEEIKSKKEKATSNAKENRKNEKKYQEKISTYTAKIQEIETELKECKTRESELSSELERNIREFNRGIQQLPNIAAELEECKADITKPRTRESELSSEIEELERNIRESNTGIQQLPDIEEELEECKADIAKPRTRESELSSEIEELEKNIEIANTKIQHLPGIRKKLEQYKADLTKPRTRESELSSEIEELEKNIEIANTRIQAISRIKKEFEQCKADIAKPRTRESELSSEIEELENGDYEKTFCDKLRDEIESVEREIETIGSANQELKIPSQLSQSDDDNAIIDEFLSAKVK